MDKGAIILSKEIQDLLKRRICRAEEAGMHVVSVVYNGLVDSLTCERSGFFDELVEAELYGEFLHKTYSEKYKTNHLVFIDGNIYRGLDLDGSLTGKQPKEPERIG